MNLFPGAALNWHRDRQLSLDAVEISDIDLTPLPLVWKPVRNRQRLRTGEANSTIGRSRKRIP